MYAAVGVQTACAPKEEPDKERKVDGGGNRNVEEAPKPILCFIPQNKDYEIKKMTLEKKGISFYKKAHRSQEKQRPVASFSGD